MKHQSSALLNHLWGEATTGRWIPFTMTSLWYAAPVRLISSQFHRSSPVCYFSLFVTYSHTGNPRPSRIPIYTQIYNDMQAGIYVGVGIINVWDFGPGHIYIECDLGQSNPWNSWSESVRYNFVGPYGEMYTKPLVALNQTYCYH